MKLDVESKTEKIKEILSYPQEERTDKMLLNLMSLTKHISPFDSIAMKQEHMNICREMTLVYYKPNDVIFKQGDPGDSFFIILTGLVKISITKQVDIGINGNKIMTEKYMNDLGPGMTFGEVSLIYGTRRTATIISIGNTCLVKLDKANFDIYVKDIFENQLKDQIDFMQICPIFHEVKKETLIKLTIRTKNFKYTKNKVILASKSRSEQIFLVRRGTVSVIKRINFVKNDLKIKSNIKDSEDFIDELAQGPSEGENYRDIILETLKMGDIFPTYYSFNNKPLDISFIAESPCELIAININDIYDIIKDVYATILNFSKPYPSDEFLRKIYYYNNSWNEYKNTLKHNILADVVNKNILDKQKMRDPLMNRRDINKIKLPNIYLNKTMHIDKISKKYKKL